MLYDHSMGHVIHLWKIAVNYKMAAMNLDVFENDGCKSHTVM